MPENKENPELFWNKVRETALTIASFESPTIVTHIDADGLCAGAIIDRTLKKIGKNPLLVPIRQLDRETILLVPKDRETIFTDLGSGQISLISEHLPGKSVIIDHHEPEKADLPERIVHLNAVEHGFSGSKEVSGAGLAFLVSLEISEIPENAPLAITGAVGDVQGQEGLIGLNRRILEIGEKLGTVRAEKGVSFFGRETRKLPDLLSTATDPFFKGLSGNPQGAVKFLEKLGIPNELTYSELSPEGKTALITGLYQYGIQAGLLPWELKRIISEYYVFPNEPKGTELRDATEFSTLLNACGRNEEALLGIKVCQGERGSAFAKTRELLALHRENLSKALELLLSKGTEPIGKTVQLLQLDEIKPTIIGIVAGIALSSRLVDSERVFLVASSQGENEYKISARGTRKLVKDGLELSKIMRKVSGEFGGLGGGHDIAAGASIPKVSLQNFCKRVDEEITSQIQAKLNRTNLP